MASDKIPPQPEQDLITSDDPQSQAAANGFQTVANTAPVQKALDFGGNLDAYGQMVHSAMAGDPTAQQQLANHSLGIAMGTTQAAPPAEGLMAKANQGVAQPMMVPLSEIGYTGRLDQAKNFLEQAEAASKLGSVSQSQLAAAQQAYNRELDNMERLKRGRYADGGEITPPPAIPSAQDASMTNAPASTPPDAAAAPQPVDQTPQAVNVINPDGKLVSVPQSQYQDALAAGYMPATDKHVSDYVKEQKYGTPGQQAITALEAGLKSATFGLSTGIETGLGLAKPEDIRARPEVNPGVETVGSIAGLGLSAFLPVGGAANILTKAGEGAAEAIGLGAAKSAIAKIGSGAVRGAVETALVQGGDEVSKAFAQDPNQTVETAVTDVGLAGLLGSVGGGALGAVSPLWEATKGSKVGEFLTDMHERLGSATEGLTAVEKSIAQAGIEVAPEVKAALTGNKYAQDLFGSLQESTTGSGRKAATSLGKFREDASNAVVTALGKTPEEVQALSNLSEREIGDKIKSDLSSNLKARLEPISKSYEKISNKFKGTALETTDKAEIGEKIAQIMMEDGGSAESASMKLANRVMEEIPGIKNLEQLRKYTSSIGNETSGIAKQELWGIGRKLQSALREAEDSVLSKTVAGEAPELIEEHALTRSAYKDLRNTISDLNDRLRVGSHAGPQTFINALNEMDGEQVLRRLNPKGKASIIEELRTSFPTIAKDVQDFHLNQLLKGASERAGSSELVNPKALFKAIEKMSPEMRSFVIPEGSMEKVGALQKLIEALPQRMNPSGTAKTLDALWSKVPESAMAVVAMLKHSNPMVGWLLGHVGNLVGREVPDAAKLAILKFMGSTKEVDAGGFKAMTDFIHSTIKGENLITKGTKAIFKAGAEVLPLSQLPTEKDREKLDKALKSMRDDPNHALQVGGKTGHYLPEQGQAIGQLAANASNYLNALRPSETPKNPLDAKPQASAPEKAQYNRALNLAQQPLTVLNHIKEGTITPQDVVTVKTLYPSLYNKLNQKLTEQVFEQVNKGQQIPYQTRQALSIFLAKPMDYTFTQQGIMNAQPIPKENQQDSGGQQGATKHKTSALNKLPGSYMTPNQSREQERSSGK